MKHQYYEKTVNSKEIFAGKIIKLQVDQVEVPGGNIHSREIIKHPGAVAVLAITDDDKIILVDQFRKPLERGLLEVPAGKLEQGEEPIVTAARELEEETGMVAGEISFLYAFYTSPGFADEIIHLFIAKNLVTKENPASADEDEFVDVVTISLSDAMQLVESGKICDAKTIIALQYLKLQQFLTEINSNQKA